MKPLRKHGVWYYRNVHVHWANWRYLIAVLPLKLMVLLILVPFGAAYLVASRIVMLCEFVMGLEALRPPATIARLYDWATAARAAEWDRAHERAMQFRATISKD